MQRSAAARAAGLIALAALAGATLPRSAAAEVRIGDARVTVSTTAGARAVIDRSPLRIRFQKANGATVLAQLPGDDAGAVARPPLPRSQFGVAGPAPPTLYAPFGFTVGGRQVGQFPSGFWQGNLTSVTVEGTVYGAREVLSAKRSGAGVQLALSTSDPSGRRLVARVAPGPDGTLRVTARPQDPDGVATMLDSFSTPPEEAFRGFGGRHNALDQRGNEFYNWTCSRRT